MSRDDRREHRELVDLCTVNDPVEAQVLEGLLADREIPCEIVTWHSTPLDGIFETQKGHAMVKVFIDHLERAQEVLADFREQAEESGD